ncbi:hypothetical protein [Variovorax sp. PCZ-1]|uniref:hypothetical protein n=1 Tax=Variovorax sp. PCZ-1 TaxID=2835533 RepID=UPI001BCCB0D6|nr:hypothetical protein [Variovorax sp. PCZ-1]MBS7809095.1 hypothetical protein [Variovorax sp. PCZ-1]
MKIRNLMIALSLAATGIAFAQTAPSSTNTPRIDKREARQEQRINKGAANGSLTAQEATRLSKGQSRVDNKQAKAEADGTVTKRERAHIHHAQNKQNRHIKRQKHDKQTVAPAAG